MEVISNGRLGDNFGLLQTSIDGNAYASALASLVVPIVLTGCSGDARNGGNVGNSTVRLQPSECGSSDLLAADRLATKGRLLGQSLHDLGTLREDISALHLPDSDSARLITQIDQIEELISKAGKP